MTVASLPRMRRLSRVPKIAAILSAPSRHRPSSQPRSNSLWIGKWRLKMKLRQYSTCEERGVAVSYETVRRWVNHFGPMIAADLGKRRLKPHTTWHLDEGVPRKHQQQWGCGAA